MTDADALLLVEGPGDREFVLHLLYALGFVRPEGVAKGRVELEDPRTSTRLELVFTGGKDELTKQFGVEAKGKRRRRIAALIDADTDPVARWHSIRERLRAADYAVPDALPAGGAVVQLDGRPTAAVWIMPDNSSPGALEHFWASMIPEDDSLWSRARAVVDELPPDERRFPPPREMKAKAHTWLAWQQEPGSTMPLSVKRQYVAPESAAVFTGWLRRWLDA